MKKSAALAYSSIAIFLTGFLALFLLVTCGGGGGGGNTSSSTGTVTTHITDPPICKAPNGSIQNVWVTITRVRAHLSNTAGAADSSWIELLDLRSHPRQIDLLNLSQTTCVLTQLGSTSGLPVGQYQQIRLYLLNNNPGSGETVPSTNHCEGNDFNCVVTAIGTKTLQLSSEAQSGIKIPSGQIAGGHFTVSAGQSVDLNIDFDACSSIVQQGNGRYRLKPVLHAGAVSLNDNSISGRIVDESGVAIPNAVVLAEQRDPDNPNIDRLMAQTITDSEGHFFFCGLAAGNCDIVASATNGKTYNTTVTLEVSPGTAMGDIPLVWQNDALPATVSGQITARKGDGSPADIDLNLSALQKIGSLFVTIPPLGDSTPNLSTGSGGAASYKLVIPGRNPQVGTFRLSPPTPYTPPASGSAIYWVNARAFVPMDGSANQGGQNCSSPSLPEVFDTSNQLAVGPGTNITGEDFEFGGCQ